MDEFTRIETFKQWLRVKFGAGTGAPDIVGLRGYIAALGDGEAADSVAITSMSFEGEQATGQLVIEPLAKLNAALAVLGEIDPTNAPTQPAQIRYANFRYFPTST